jgi:hypothetical protein
MKDLLRDLSLSYNGKALASKSATIVKIPLLALTLIYHNL